MKKKLESLGPEGMRKKRKRNRELKNIMRRIVLFNDFLLDERAFGRAATNLRRDHFTHIQAAKANINEIKNFMLRLLKNTENFCVQYFGQKITIITENQKLLEDSLFIVKSFVHQLYNDLSSAFVKPDDLPKSIRAIFKEFIREKAQLAPGYLSTFEFNRLEFDVRCRLNNMNKQRRSLIIGFVIFYRVLLIEIFKNYLLYFPRIRDMGNPIGEVLNKKVKKGNKNVNGMSRKNIHPDLQKEVENLTKKGNNQNENDINLIDKFNGPDADTQILYYKKRKMEIRNNLIFNFNFIIQVLDNIVRRAFKNNPPKYNDYFKNKHLYNLMVFSAEMDRNRQLVTSNDNDDDIEIMKGIYTPSEDCDLFLKDHQRWMHMYELSTIELCGDLANKIMDDEVPKPVKGFNINSNQYAINRPQNNQNVNNKVNNEGDDNNNALPKINNANNRQDTNENNQVKNTEENKEDDKEDDDEDEE